MDKIADTVDDFRLMLMSLSEGESIPSLDHLQWSKVRIGSTHSERDESDCLDKYKINYDRKRIATLQLRPHASAEIINQYEPDMILVQNSLVRALDDYFPVIKINYQEFDA
jgi:hypothetical protein